MFWKDLLTEQAGIPPDRRGIGKVLGCWRSRFSDMPATVWLTTKGSLPASPVLFTGSRVRRGFSVDASALQASSYRGLLWTDGTASCRGAGENRALEALDLRSRFSSLRLLVSDRPLRRGCAEAGELVQDAGYLTTPPLHSAMTAVPSTCCRVTLGSEKPGPLTPPSSQASAGPKIAVQVRGFVCPISLTTKVIHSCGDKRLRVNMLR